MKGGTMILALLAIILLLLLGRERIADLAAFVLTVAIFAAPVAFILWMLSERG